MDLETVLLTVVPNSFFLQEDVTEMTELPFTGSCSDKLAISLPVPPL